MSVARAEDRAPWRHDPSADPGAKTEGGRHDAALSFPFGIGTKAANRPSLFQCALYLISRPWFLHFTLNHHNGLLDGLLQFLDLPAFLGAGLEVAIEAKLLENCLKSLFAHRYGAAIRSG